MYITNEFEFGRLLVTGGVRTDKIHPDMWQIKENPKVLALN